MPDTDDEPRAFGMWSKAEIDALLFKGAEVGRTRVRLRPTWRLTQVERREVLKMRRDGHTVEEIHERTGISRGHIGKLLRDAGLSTSDRRPARARQPASPPAPR